MDNHGELERRSMVYTEFFASGTAPTDYCDLHPTQGILTRLASVFGAGDKLVPPSVEETSLTTLKPGAGVTPPVPVGTSGQSAPVAVGSVGQSEIPPAVKKKAGFWSKVFGKEKADEAEKPARPDDETESRQK